MFITLNGFTINFMITSQLKFISNQHTIYGNYISPASTLIIQNDEFIDSVKKE